MDYEKKYKEALERARRFFDEGKTLEYAIDIATTIFPELAESEDERTWIINYLNNRKLNSSIIAEKENLKKAIAWLEKQGESYTKRDVDDAYLKGVTDTKKEIEKQYEANYQIRKDIATFIFNYRGDIKDRAKWIDYLGIKVSFVEKQSEQKPVTDDKNAEKAAEEYRNYRMSCGIKDPVMLNEIEEAYYEGTISKQKPVEWSEEDEKYLDECVNIIYTNAFVSIHDKKPVLDWLKSLRPQKQWKPSEEQMEAVEKALSLAKNCGEDYSFDLRKLLEQLKAL